MADGNRGIAAGIPDHPLKSPGVYEMPNGGLDNCATCWFNRKNEGRHGHNIPVIQGESYCIIRHIRTAMNDADAAHTYCLNHPYVRRFRDPIPIGPIYKHDNATDGRRVAARSPDTEEIRGYLLALLGEITPPYISAYPESAVWLPSDVPHRVFHLDNYYKCRDSVHEIAIRQLGEFREVRAIAPLREYLTINRKAIADSCEEIAQMPPDNGVKPEIPPHWLRLIVEAERALEMIETGRGEPRDTFD